MSDVLGWILVGILIVPVTMIYYDWARSEWERRHRPMWPPPDMEDEERLR